MCCKGGLKFDFFSSPIEWSIIPMEFMKELSPHQFEITILIYVVNSFPYVDWSNKVLRDVTPNRLINLIFKFLKSSWAPKTSNIILFLFSEHVKY